MAALQRDREAVEAATEAQAEAYRSAVDALHTGHAAERRRLAADVEAERERAEVNFKECLAQRQHAAQLRERLQRREAGAAPP